MSQIQWLLVVACAAACWRGAPAPDHTPSSAVRRARPTTVAVATATATATAAVAPRTQPLSADTLLATIRGSYLSGLQRCYTQQLKRDPRARGTVTLTMTVDASGRLTAQRADGVGPRVENCVEQQMRRWEFPPPADEAEQSFRLSLELAPR